jgi:hypothetical protein
MGRVGSRNHPNRNQAHTAGMLAGVFYGSSGEFDTRGSVLVRPTSPECQPLLHGRAHRPVRTIARVRVLPHIKRLDDALGDFIVRVTCPCGASRHIEPEALARIAGRSASLATLALRMRCSQCGKKVAEVVAVARPRPRGGGRRQRDGA